MLHCYKRACFLDWFSISLTYILELHVIPTSTVKRVNRDTSCICVVSWTSMAACCTCVGLGVNTSIGLYACKVSIVQVNII